MNDSFFSTHLEPCPSPQVVYLFSRKEEVTLHPKSNIYNFRRSIIFRARFAKNDIPPTSRTEND